MEVRTAIIADYTTRAHPDRQDMLDRLRRLFTGRPAIIVGCVAAIYLLLGFFGVPALLRWQIDRQVPALLDHKVTVGALRFNPILLRLQADDLGLADSRGRTLVAVDRLVVDFALRSAIDRAWTFSEVSLAGPKVAFEVDAQGAHNFQPLLDRVRALQGEPQAESKAEPTRFAVRRLSVERAHIEYRDRLLAEPLVASIDPLDVVVEDLSTLPSRLGRYRVAARGGATARAGREPRRSGDTRARGGWRRRRPGVGGRAARGRRAGGQVGDAAAGAGRREVTRRARPAPYPVTMHNAGISPGRLDSKFGRGCKRPGTQEETVNRRRALITAAAALALASTARAQSAQPLVEVWKSPTCGCCKDWVRHLETNGFRVKTVEVQSTAQARARMRIPERLGSCHTAAVGGYALEGHVPAREIRRMLAERPDAVGLAVPGMPIGSPGMDGPEYGGRKDPYDVLLVAKDGTTRSYQAYR